MTKKSPITPPRDVLLDLSSAAVKVRRERAAFLDRLRSGRVEWTEFPAELDQAAADEGGLGRIWISEFLTAIPRVGPSMAADILDAADVPSRRRLQALTPKRRDALVRETFRHRSRMDFTAKFANHKATAEQTAAILRQRKVTGLHFMQADDLLDNTQGTTRVRGRARRSRVLGDLDPSVRLVDIDPADRRRMARALTR